MSKRHFPRLASETASALALLLAASCVFVAGAQAHKKEPKWEARVRIEEGHNDNVRSAADGPQKTGTNFTTADVFYKRKARERGLIPDEIWTRLRGRVYTQFNTRNFAELRGGASYELGHATDFLLQYGYVPRRLRLEENATTNNAFATEYDLNAGLQNRFGTRKQARARLLVKESYDDFRSGFSRRSAQTTAIAGDLRYQFSPTLGGKIGTEYGQRTANGEDFDRKEWRYKASFRKRFSHGTTFDIRASYRDGSYTVNTPFNGIGRRNKNFGRRDTTWEYEAKLSVPLPFVEGLRVALRYRYKDAASSRSSRIFDLNEVGLGFSYDIPHRGPESTSKSKK